MGIDLNQTPKTMIVNEALEKIIASLADDIKKGVVLSVLRANCESLGANADLALKIVRLAELRAKN